MSLALALYCITWDPFNFPCISGWSQGCRTMNSWVALSLSVYEWGTLCGSEGLQREREGLGGGITPVVTKWLWMSMPKGLPLALPPQLVILPVPCPPPLHIAHCASCSTHHPVGPCQILHFPKPEFVHTATLPWACGLSLPRTHTWIQLVRRNLCNRRCPMYCMRLGKYFNLNTKCFWRKTMWLK